MGWHFTHCSTLTFEPTCPVPHPGTFSLVLAGAQENCQRSICSSPLRSPGSGQLWREATETWVGMSTGGNAPTQSCLLRSTPGCRGPHVQTEGPHPDLPHRTPSNWPHAKGLRRNTNVQAFISAALLQFLAKSIYIYFGTNVSSGSIKSPGLWGCTGSSHWHWFCQVHNQW